MRLHSACVLFVCLCLATFCSIYGENATEINSANYLCLVYSSHHWLHPHAHTNTRYLHLLFHIWLALTCPFRVTCGNRTSPASHTHTRTPFTAFPCLVCGHLHTQHTPNAKHMSHRRKVEVSQIQCCLLPPHVFLPSFWTSFLCQVVF